MVNNYGQNKRELILCNVYYNFEPSVYLPERERGLVCSFRQPEEHSFNNTANIRLKYYS